MMSEVTVDRFYMPSDYGWIDEPEPEPKDGSIVINGDLTTDLSVDGNLEVTGLISGNVEATGTITYGSLTGTIAQNAEVPHPCLTVEKGSLTFASSVTTQGGVLYTAGEVYTDAGSVVEINCDLTIEASVTNTLYNDASTMTVPQGVTVRVVSELSSGQAVWNTGTFSLSGDMYVEAANYGFRNSNSVCTVEKTGRLYASGGVRALDNNGSSVFTIYGHAEGTNADYGLYSNDTANFIVAEGATVVLSGLNTGLHNSYAVTVEGDLSSTGTPYAIYNTGSSATFEVGEGGVVTLHAENPESVTSSATPRGLFNFFGASIIYGTVTADVTGISSGGVYVGGGTVEIYGTVSATASGGSSSGVYCQDSGNIKVYSGAVVTASSEDAYGVHISSGQMDVDGQVSASGGFYGVYNRGAINVSYGALTATGNDAGVYNYSGTFTITEGATVTAEGTGSSSSGVYNTGGTFTVSGTLNATGGGYGLNNADSFATSTIESTATAVLTGGSYAIYNNGGTCRVRSGAKVTYNGGIYGVTYG